VLFALFSALLAPLRGSIRAGKAARPSNDPICFRALAAWLCLQGWLAMVQRSHHAYACEHRRAAAFGNQQQRLHRSQPFFGIMFGLGQAR